MHIRDFTIDESSGVINDLRGTYLGAVEENTIYKNPYNGKYVKTGIDHLCELGITHVHLMPIFDFGSVDERFPGSNNRNWGMILKTLMYQKEAIVVIHIILLQEYLN